MQEFQLHRSHDYRHLVNRWRAVARKAGIRLVRFAEASEQPLFYLKSRALRATGGIYISAGIHGDEPAATEALITWAETNVDRLATLPCILFPCLNPWGLINNRRSDEAGLDLNRCFHLADLPMISALRATIAAYQFRVALMLHEDYDAQGLYLYETEKEKPFWAEQLIERAATVIPIDPRRRIERRQTLSPGIVRRKLRSSIFKKMGFPEAIYLHQHHSARTFTIETPSEAALEQRIAAHVVVLDECIRLALLKA